MVNLVIEKESSMIFMRTSGPTEFLFRSLPVIFAAPAESHGLLQSCTLLPLPARNAPRLTVDYGQPGLFVCLFFPPLFSFDNCRTSHFPPRHLVPLMNRCTFFLFFFSLRAIKNGSGKRQKRRQWCQHQSTGERAAESTVSAERVQLEGRANDGAAAEAQGGFITDDYRWLFTVNNN